MSARSIARWNAIPMERPELPMSETSTSSLKRTREDEESDDDISIASRTPSPQPEGMDVDKYDEYVPGHMEREVITVDTKIKPTNIGFSMLAKMGWTEGQPVGLSGEGRVDPIPFTVKHDQTGLGKVSQDVEMIETTVAQRRELDSERYAKQSKEQKRMIEEDAARKAALQSSIDDTLRAFYCALCDKQFKNVTQYDEHTNSYAHAHKSREKDMKASFKIGTALGVDERREKERAREEKELRKLAKAQGIKLAGSKPVQSAQMSETSSAPPDAVKPDVPASSGGWAPGSINKAPASFMAPTPAFRAGGQVLMEDQGTNVPAGTPAAPLLHSSVAVPAVPMQGTSALAAALQASPYSSAGWSGASVSAPHQNTLPVPTVTVLPDPPPAPQEANVQGTALTAAAIVAPSPIPRPQQPPPEPKGKQDRETKRSGWQQFRAGKAGRR